MRRWPAWSASMDAFDVEVCALRLPGGPTLVGLPLAPSHWRACDKKGFFPRAVARAGFEPLLRRSVCFAMLQLAEVGPGDVIVDPMAGSGSLPVEAARAFGARWVLGGDLTRVATRQAKFARRVCPELEVARWDARRLPLRSAVADAVVTDIPWGNRSRGDPLLLRDALAEARRLLRPGGRAVLLMTRVAAAACARLDSGSRPRRRSTLSSAAGPPRSSGCGRARRRGGRGGAAGGGAGDGGAGGGGDGGAAVDDDDDDVPAFAGVARSALTPCCCAVVVGVLYAELSVAEILLSEWPELVPTISAARRAIKHRRVSRASALDTHVVWWREKVAVGERLVFRPHLARHEPYDEPLRVLWEAGDFLCVHKPPGMQVLRGRRSLANALHAMQAARGAPRPPPGDAVAAAVGRRRRRRAGGAAVAPAYDGGGRVDGAWLVTKTATAALALLDGDDGKSQLARDRARSPTTPTRARRRRRQPAAARRRRRRCASCARASVRYRAIAEVELRCAAGALVAARLTAPAPGHRRPSTATGRRRACGSPPRAPPPTTRRRRALPPPPPAPRRRAASRPLRQLFEREEQVRVRRGRRGDVGVREGADGEGARPRAGGGRGAERARVARASFSLSSSSARAPLHTAQIEAPTARTTLVPMVRPRFGGFALLVSVFSAHAQLPEATGDFGSGEYPPSSPPPSSPPRPPCLPSSVARWASLRAAACRLGPQPVARRRALRRAQSRTTPPRGRRPRRLPRRRQHGDLGDPPVLEALGAASRAAVRRRGDHFAFLVDAGRRALTVMGEFPLVASDFDADGGLPRRRRPGATTTVKDRLWAQLASLQANASAFAALTIWAVGWSSTPSGRAPAARSAFAPRPFDHPQHDRPL